MLNIVIPSAELWDEKNEQFIHTKERKLQLEHSLVSVAKWEAKWNKPFINKKEKTTAEIIDYVRCMTITQNVPDDCYNYLTIANIIQHLVRTISIGLKDSVIMYSLRPV